MEEQLSQLQRELGDLSELRAQVAKERSALEAELTELKRVRAEVQSQLEAARSQQSFQSQSDYDEEYDDEEDDDEESTLVHVFLVLEDAPPVCVGGLEISGDGASLAHLRGACGQLRDLQGRNFTFLRRVSEGGYESIARTQERQLRAANFLPSLFVALLDSEDKDESEDLTPAGTPLNFSLAALSTPLRAPSVSTRRSEAGSVSAQSTATHTSNLDDTDMSLIRDYVTPLNEDEKYTACEHLRLLEKSFSPRLPFSLVDDAIVPNQSLTTELQRRLLFHSRLGKVCRRGPPRTYEFHLFSDVLVYSRARRGGTFRVHRVMPLTQVVVMETPVSHSDVPHSFLLSSSTKSFVVCAESEVLKRTWVALLQHARRLQLQLYQKYGVEEGTDTETDSFLASPAGSPLAPVWLRDESTNSCMLCGTGFRTFRRRHHCSFPV
ncbi:MAG: hypothetical protein MHM6MM_002516 [Cercozoa sp. M6MM]